MLILESLKRYGLMAVAVPFVLGGATATAATFAGQSELLLSVDGAANPDAV